MEHLPPNSESLLGVILTEGRHCKCRAEDSCPHAGSEWCHRLTVKDPSSRPAHLPYPDAARCLYGDMPARTQQQAGISPYKQQAGISPMLPVAYTGICRPVAGFWPMLRSWPANTWPEPRSLARQFRRKLSTFLTKAAR